MKGWKTLIVSAALAAGGVAEQAEWIDLVGEANAGAAVTVIAVVMAGLRAFTTTPMGKS